MSGQNNKFKNTAKNKSKKQVKESVSKGSPCKTNFFDKWDLDPRGHIEVAYAELEEQL